MKIWTRFHPDSPLSDGDVLLLSVEDTVLLLRFCVIANQPMQFFFALSYSTRRDLPILSSVDTDLESVLLSRTGFDGENPAPVLERLLTRFPGPDNDDRIELIADRELVQAILDRVCIFWRTLISQLVIRVDDSRVSCPRWLFEKARFVCQDYSRLNPYLQHLIRLN